MNDVRKKTGIIFFLIFLMAWGGVSIFATQKQIKTKKQTGYDSDIPKTERAKIQKRLNLFTHYQLTEQWEKLSEVLGGNRLENYERTRFTLQEMAAQIEKLKRHPITVFNWQSTTFSTEILSVSQKKKWWYLSGFTTSISETAPQLMTVRIEVYQINGEWYFTPSDPVPFRPS